MLFSGQGSMIPYAADGLAVGSDLQSGAIEFAVDEIALKYTPLHILKNAITGYAAGMKLAFVSGPVGKA